MSLLMDALKKAEAAKRQAGTDALPAEARDAGERPGEEPSAAAEGSARLELIDERFEAESIPVNPRFPAASAVDELQREREREAAHRLFEAKRPPSRAPFWIGVTVFTIVSFSTLGAWFWWQMRPYPGALQGGPNLAVAPLGQPPRPAAGAAMQPGAALPATSQGQPPAASAAPVPGPDARTGLPAADTQPLEARPRTFTRERASPTVGHLAAEPAAVAPLPAGPQLRRTAPPRETVPPAVARGYAAYSAGDLTTAKREYENGLRADPRSLDALNGLAATALRAGRRDVAEAYLTRALEVDPKDAYALATIAGLRGTADPAGAESRLKSATTTTPDSAPAKFALGNLYARQNRWQEAQQAYFEAYTAEPDNADYQFNLAVSLDHLRQPRLAQQFYAGALAAPRPGAFDRAQTESRLRELQQAP